MFSWDRHKYARQKIIDIYLVENLSASVVCHLVTNPMQCVQGESVDNLRVIHGISIENAWIIHGEPKEYQWIIFGLFMESMIVHRYPRTVNR